MREPSDVVVVGEGVAGVTVARELRDRGYAGRLTLVGAETAGAYARPPLSKQVLWDAAAEDAVGYDVDSLGAHHLRRAAVALRPDERRVVIADGAEVRYDALVLATGSAARTLAAPGQTGELVLRTLADARRVRRLLVIGRRVVVVGAGFLGMEVASAAAHHGDEVTVVDVDRPLERLLGPYLSAALTREAKAAGIRFVRGGPARLVGNPATGVRLPDGRHVDADVVVTCIGDDPLTAWLAGSGLDDPDGIEVDERCATALPGVYAVGDVARLGAERRPFWSNAVAQAKVAAASVLGVEPTGTPTDDYFWTTVAGVGIKVVGPIPITGEVEVVEGDVASRRAVLRATGPRGTTVVAYGARKSPHALRRLAERSTV